MQHISNQVFFEELLEELKWKYILEFTDQTVDFELREGDYRVLEKRVGEFLDDYYLENKHADPHILGRVVSFQVIKNLFSNFFVPPSPDERMIKTLTKVAMFLGYTDWTGYKRKCVKKISEREHIKDLVSQLLAKELLIVEQSYYDYFEPGIPIDIGSLYLIRDIYSLTLQAVGKYNCVVRNIGTKSKIQLKDIAFSTIDDDITPLKVVVLYDLLMYVYPDSWDKYWMRDEFGIIRPIKEDIFPKEIWDVKVEVTTRVAARKVNKEWTLEIDLSNCTLKTEWLEKNVVKS